MLDFIGRYRELNSLDLDVALLRCNRDGPYRAAPTSPELKAPRLIVFFRVCSNISDSISSSNHIL